MTPLFVATEKFDSVVNTADWKVYVTGTNLTHLIEVVTLDGTLCPRVPEEAKREYWPHIVNEDFMGQFFTDLNFLLQEVAHIPNKNILCVYREPTATPTAPISGDWEFLGYDLVDFTHGISALTNCGGFPKAFDEAELSRCGLIGSLPRAREVQQRLRAEYKAEPHADCHIWAIFRSAA